MTATFKDVARLAGVSTQTVSRVTNGAENVSNKTRERVLAAIDELGYIPNKAAQALKVQNKIIGLITLDMALHGAAMIANGVRQQAHEAGYTLAISAVDDLEDHDIESAVRELIAQQVESIIINAPVSAELATELVGKYTKVKLLFIDVSQDTQVNAVCSANENGARKGAELLIKQQRNKPVFLTGPHISHASQLRTQIWRDVFTKQAFSVVAELEGDWSAASGYQAMRRAIMQNRDFDSVLVANDQMALGALRALNEMGIEVPSSVSVIGFDGTEDSEFFSPPLTTIKQDFTLLGQTAVNKLLATTFDHVDITHIDVSLIERASTAPRDQDSGSIDQARKLLDKALRLLEH
ncbi:substrate-binding domain-containing protein [Photobacterium sp. ZSDE20]|uniref:LacI family DNA-binding transcriptional regulator n=1 Tax=Photobacterium pectinilyticum TaxID=2906793 RepID=A0ABT1NAS1_9GAMM|nr:LacI family DNA-binding transcriptional regulator [Photobacterium sp. ZSDE20]MCQ1060414.1 LacI family DNA-binding transcriptional regulator [Photobacterium sp. ZSDE20]MDD1827735.1 substrate-binding domain-containing protein [Photobacterium sp. ZSDE20]